MLCLQADSNTTVTISALNKLYIDNQDIFKATAFHIQSTNREISNLDQLFNEFLNNSKQMQTSHNLWRITCMTPARLLRQLFLKPDRLPKTAGIGVERFISIDTKDGPAFPLPTTDCSNMFIYQAKGSRTIHLQPTTECEQHCRRILVRLEENFMCEFQFVICFFKI